jgi:hypothetical protein
MRAANLNAELARLPDMAGEDLRSRWTALVDGPAPKVSPRMLRLALGWQLQAKAHGGLSRRTNQRLEQIAAAKTRTREIRQGMRLMREWNGVLHVVTVGEDDVIRWNDREWRSLSEIARIITGTRWSGPAFFGLRYRRKAA